MISTTRKPGTVLLFVLLPAEVSSAGVSSAGLAAALSRGGVRPAPAWSSTAASAHGARHERNDASSTWWCLADTAEHPFISKNDLLLNMRSAVRHAHTV